MSKGTNLRISVAALALVAMLGGCQSIEEPAAEVPVTTPPVPEVALTAIAGVPVPAIGASADRNKLVARANYGKRPDPFALKPEEAQHERRMEMLRVAGELGWTVEYTPPEPEGPRQEDIPEPQPYRRLAGVVVGDSILALIDMGGGQLEIIRPGQQIPNSEWRVVSIDSEKAILRRSGNRTPRQIVVRLESPPPGMTGGLGQPGGGFGPGGPGGFGPGGPGGPAGRPGGAGFGKDEG